MPIGDVIFRGLDGTGRVPNWSVDETVANKASVFEMELVAGLRAEPSVEDILFKETLGVFAQPAHIVDTISIARHRAPNHGDSGPGEHCDGPIVVERIFPLARTRVGNVALEQAIHDSS